MKTFKDATGRTWEVSVHVAAVARCRAHAGVDLYGLVDDGFKPLGALVGDPVSLVNLMYVLCKAESRGVGEEEFGEAMYGDAIRDAAEAFVAELFDFFPDPRVRAGLAKVRDASRMMKEKLLDRMEADIDAIDPAASAAAWIETSGGAPASSGSTPDLSRSAS